MLYDPKWTPPETEIKLESWQTLLLEAATILETKGWTRGFYADDNGYCVLGALRAASGMMVNKTYSTAQLRTNYPDYWAATHALAKKVIVEQGGGIGNWNDAQSSKDVVIATMRDTAHAV